MDIVLTNLYFRSSKAAGSITNIKSLGTNSFPPLQIGVGENYYHIEGNFSTALTTNLFKRLIKKDCPILFVGKIKTHVNIDTGIVSIETVDGFSHVTIPMLTFKQKYKHPVKKLQKALDDCIITGYDLTAYAALTTIKGF